MLNNFIYTKQKSLFENALNNGEVLNEAIAFIEDTKEIWNHGTYYGGTTGGVDLTDYITNAQLTSRLNTKQDIISDLETIRANASSVVTEKNRAESEEAKIREEFAEADALINSRVTTINNSVSTLDQRVEAVENFVANEDYATKTELEGYATIAQLNTKQNNISDLEAIREGAALGATAILMIPSEYITETELNAKGYAISSEVIAELSNKVDAVNGMGLSSNDYTTDDKNKLGSITAGAEVNVQSDWNVTDSTSDAFIKNKPTFAKVATSGSYEDLSNKPDIPSAVTESTVSGWGFTKNTGTYSVPSGGIPLTDLSDEVKALLAKANTALQSYTEQYTGTYNKPSGGIPESDLASSVQTSLGKADTALQSFTESDPIFKASVAYSITDDDIANWNNKVSPISGKGLSTNDFTTTLKNKLDGIASGAEVNQNAFAKIAIGSTTIEADAKQDTLTLVAGSNVTITPDATNDKITIAATDTNTTYTFVGGTNKFTVTPSGGTAQTVNVTPSIAVVSTTANGLMSKDDKIKLNGLSNYNDTTVKNSINSIQSLLDTLVSGNASTAINSFNEITSFLKNIEDSSTLEGIIGGINTLVASKAEASSVVTSITRSGNTFTAKNASGTSLFTFDQKDNNTTYTFTGGTNQFTVTPSGGTAQTVTVTPSISKNVTYTGTLVDEQVATFEGTTGTIKASGFTIATSVPANAKFTDTTYSSKTAASGGTAVSLVTTGEKYTWNQAATAVATKVTADGISVLKEISQTDYDALGSKGSSTLYVITS